jgi:hypothetical protein
MPFVILPTNSASGGYDVTNSLRFNSGSNDFLSRTTGTPTNNKILTFSAWIKRSNITTYMDLFDQDGGSSYGQLQLTNGDAFVIYQRTSGSTDFHLQTTQLFRDVSAWYHLVVAYDTTQATSSNRIKLYVNGTQVTSFSIETYPSQNLAIRQNTSSLGITIANYSSGSNQYAGYLSDIFMIDGQQLTPTSFGETDTDTGIWKPKAFSGTYGTNGFYLQFKNSASLGTDSSGNGNTFTVNNLTSIDQTTDTPTNNFATLISNFGVRASTETYSEGNLKVVGSGNAFEFSPSSIAPSSGKWYFEAKMESKTNYPTIGFQETSQARTNNKWIAETTQGYGLHHDGTLYNNNASTGSLTGYTTGDIMSVALDLDNGKAYFRKNGTWLGSADPANGTNPAFSSIPSGTYYLGVSNYNSTWGANFGNPYYSANSYTDGAGYGNFSYQVPSGYFSLNTKNLALYG